MNRETRVGRETYARRKQKGMQYAGAKRRATKRSIRFIINPPRSLLSRTFRRGGNGYAGEEMKRWNFLGSEMRFSPVFSSFLARDRRTRGSRTVAAGRFSKNLFSSAERDVHSGWTMVAYVSTYKSRIVQPPMFSRPHINPGGEKAVHPAIVQ